MDTSPGGRAHVPAERLPASPHRLRLVLGVTSLAPGAAAVLEQALKQAPGVMYVYFDGSTEMAYVEYDPAVTDEDQLIADAVRAGSLIAITKREGHADAE